MKATIEITLSRAVQAEDVKELFSLAESIALEKSPITIETRDGSETVTLKVEVKTEAQGKSVQKMLKEIWISVTNYSDSCISFGEKPPPPEFTEIQGQYLAFIHQYVKLNRQAPAFMDFERHFRTAPSSVNQMIKTLEKKGFIEKTPGAARSIRLLIPEEKLPPLS